MNHPAATRPGPPTQPHPRSRVGLRSRFGLPSHFGRPSRLRPLRSARLLAAVAAAGLLAGCMYDPYTGTYYPCCGSPPPAYGYPAAAPYYGPPYGASQPQYPSPYYAPPYAAQPFDPGYPPGSAPTQPYGYAPQSFGSDSPADADLAQRFAAANVTRDGRLTLQQARAANWQAIAENFPDIDVEQKGYVTLNEIRVWLETHAAPPAGTRG